MIRTAIALAAVAALGTGCFLDAGMRMDEDALHERGKGTQDAAAFRLIPITPQVLAKLSRSRAEAEAAAHARSESPPAAPGYEYRISPHDVLSVIVWEHPELTIPAGEFRSAETTGYPVSAAGSIFFPHVGTLRVAGHTPEEVREELTRKLAVFVREPQLQVLVASYRGKRAMVAGEVLQPSAVPITDVPLRVQDAIGAARGFTADADLGHVTLTRDGIVHHLDLQALYERGDAAQNWVLQDGDLVHVPDRSRNRVFVLGEVKKPATLPMAKGKMTLVDALGSTEGPEPIFANPGRILVFRGQYERPEIYLLDASSADALLLAASFQLEPRDVVYVSTSNLGRFSRVVNQILPTVQGLWQTYNVIRYR